MAASPPLEETNLAFRNEKDLHFRKVQREWGLDHKGISYGSAMADFDRDGDLDLVYTNVDAPVSLYRNDSPAGESIVVELKGMQGNTHGVGAQIIARTEQGIQTRRLSVARGALSSSEPVMHIGLGTATRVERLEVRWPGGQVQVWEDLPTGYRHVITEPAAAGGPAPVVASRPVDNGLFQDEADIIGVDFENRERVFNDMIRQSLLPHKMNTLGGGVAWGDANGDGSPDLFLAGGAGIASALYLNDGQGLFSRSTAQQPWDAAIEVEQMAPVWIDVDADGTMDLVVSCGGVEADSGSDALVSRLYLNDGNALFREASLEQMDLPPFSASVVSAADFDLDGDLDLFIGGRVVPGEYPTAPMSALLENREGVLVDVTDTVCPSLRRLGMVTAALWTQAAGDDRPDLLLAGEWMSLRLFRNEGTLVEVTAGTGLEQYPGWWNSLTGADLNRDGAIDYIAGKTGLNTSTTRVRSTRPISIMLITKAPESPRSSRASSRAKTSFRSGAAAAVRWPCPA